MIKKLNRQLVTEASFCHEITMPDGSSFDVVNKYYDNSRLVSPMADAIAVFPGFAEQYIVAQKSLALLASLGARAVAPVVEFEQIPRSIKRGSAQMADALWAVATQTPKNTANFMHEIGYSDEAIKSIGNSSGAGILSLSLGLADGPDEHFEDMVLLEPAGLTNIDGQICDTTAGLMGKFLRGAVLVTPPWRSGIGAATHDCIKEAWRERRTLIGQFELANTATATSNVVAHSEKHAVSIISGSKDTVFPYDDIIATLEAGRIDHQKFTVEIDTLGIALPYQPTQPGLNVYHVPNTRHENLSYPRGQRMLCLGAQILGVVA